MAVERLAVTVVLYRPDRPGEDALRNALAALGRQTLAPTVAVLVNADDGTTPWLEAHPVVTEVVRTRANLGFAGGHDLLLRRVFDAGAELAVVHNPDLALAPDALAELAAAAGDHPLALLGPLLELGEPGTLAPTGLLDTAGVVWTWDGRHLDAGQGRPLRPGATEGGAPRPVAALSGACLAVPRAAHERVVAACGEFFDEDFLAYREDAELGLRAGLLGVPSLLVPRARGVHARGARGTARGASAHVDRLGVRNRFLIAAKYGSRRPGTGPGPWLRDAVVVAAVLARERSSVTGLVEAWRLRHVMRAKGRRLRQAAGRP